MAMNSRGAVYKTHQALRPPPRAPLVTLRLACGGGSRKTRVLITGLVFFGSGRNAGHRWTGHAAQQDGANCLTHAPLSLGQCSHLGDATLS